MQEKRGSVLAPVKAKIYPRLESAPQLGGEGSGFPPRYYVATGQHNHIVLGVDLGSRNMRVAALENDEVSQVLPPLSTTLALTHTGFWAVGKNARDAAPNNQYANIFRDARVKLGTGWHRLLGGEGVDGEILTRLLIHNMLQILGRSHEGALRDIVLTVPASYTSMERKLLKNACEVLDLQVVQLINEPTAAVLAYCQNNKIQEGNFLIFHVGASSCAATVYNFTRGIIEVRATSCSHELGSNSFDDLLIQYLIAQFVIEFKAKPLIDQDSLQLFEKAAVNLKEGLSKSNQAFYQIHGLKYALGQAYNALENKNPVLQCTIGRPTFSALTEPLVDKMLEHVNEVMRAAKLSNTQEITRLLVSGEGSKLFSLRDKLTEIATADGLAILDEFMPARGAAMQAGLVCQTNKDLIIWDLLTRPIYVVTGSGVTTELISINTPLPVTAYFKLSIKDSTVNARLVQGFMDEQGLFDGNATQTDVVINNCPPSLQAVATYGDKQVELAVRVSHDGIITYGARHLGLGVALLVTPLQDVPRHYQSGIERHLDNRETSALADNQKAVRLARKLNLPLFGLNGALVAMGFSAEQISSGAAVYLALHTLKSAKRKLKRNARIAAKNKERD